MSERCQKKISRVVSSASSDQFFAVTYSLVDYELRYLQFLFPFMSAPERLETVTEAFTSGYHSEFHEGATHSVHNLRKDALAITGHLPKGTDVSVDAVWDALLYGVDVQLYEDTDEVLSHLSGSGDSIVIWSQGDRQAQLAKVRNAGWEVALGNPHDRSNFRVVAGEDKMPFLPMIAEFSHDRRRNTTLYILEDSLKNLTSAQSILAPYAGTHDIRYVWINRKGGTDPVPEGISVVSSLTEYEALVSSGRTEGETVTHALDLDATLINPKGSESSRRLAVERTVAEGVRYKRVGRPVFRPLDGLHVVDHDEIFLKIHGGEIKSFDFAGHQASIYAANGYLVKIFAHDYAKRPQTSEWQTPGGYRGAKALAHAMNGYRERLRATGFRVPHADFMVARDKNGVFVPIEVVPNLGKSLQDVFLTGTREERIHVARRILEASRPVLLAEGIGADIKPANFVEDQTGTYVHIDPLPMILVDTDGAVITEWPPIASADLDPFLSKTHMTPQAIGFRYFQELCQLDVANRTGYRDMIREEVTRWQETGLIGSETLRDIINAVEPAESVMLSRVLNRDVLETEGFSQIFLMVQGYAHRKEHPIYALREMSFLLSEYIIRQGLEMNGIVGYALGVVGEELGEAARAKIAGAVDAVPEQLKFLTIVRKLTHLSQKDWQAGREEYAALRVMERVTHGLLSYDSTRQNVS